MGIKGTYLNMLFSCKHLNIIKAIYDKPAVDTSISSKIRNKTRMPTLAAFIQHSFESPSHNNQRKTKRIQIGKEEVKLSLQMT